MLLITKRREIGAICGHTVYAISKSEMIPLPNPTVLSNLPNSRDEDRSISTLCSLVDLMLLLKEIEKRHSSNFC